MVLHVDNARTFRLLSRSNVEKTLQGLKRFTKNSVWVGNNNRYSSDTTKKIAAEIATGGLTNPRHLSHYIAVSSLLHCSDGWSYLGNAISALLKGDPHRSLHLAYYAELRAAIALLATEGIGVFNNRHAIINGPNSSITLPKGSGTHDFAWDCLEFWGDQSASGDVFTAVIRPNGIRLEDWLQPIGGGSVVAPQAKQWFWTGPHLNRTP